jgi:ATP-dependent 26S proteasome regulatory subunit
VNPDFVQFICDYPGSVIILEDCDELLLAREAGSQNSGITNLLNLGDGLLGDALKLKIICTFNTPLKRIDEALLRKGRLAQRYEFLPLNEHKANHLLKANGSSFRTKEPMTLADIFNYGTENDRHQERTGIGFR